jgi:hypothetical protein
MQDLADRLAADIDRASSHAPASGPAVDTILAGGRQALLRRRLALGAGTAAAALVIGGTLWVVAPGGGTTATDDSQVATQPSSSTAPATDADPLEGDLLAGYDSDGNLVVKDGWNVTERIPNPMGVKPPEQSVALELTNGTKSYWYLLRSDEKGWGASSDPAQKGFATLEEWTASQVGANQPDPIGDALDLQPDGRLVSSDDDVVVVDQRTGVDLGASFGPAADTTVAELRVDGVRWFVTALDHVSGGWELGPPLDTPKAGTTLDSYVDYLRAQYASGEGVR